LNNEDSQDGEEQEEGDFYKTDQNFEAKKVSKKVFLFFYFLSNPL